MCFSGSKVCFYFIQISPKFVPRVPIDNTFALVPVTTWWHFALQILLSLSDSQRNYTLRVLHYRYHNWTLTLGLLVSCHCDLVDTNQLVSWEREREREREREIKFIGLFEDRGHRGPYSPYKPFNHNLYIGIIIFPHIDNPQSTGYN